MNVATSPGEFAVAGRPAFRWIRATDKMPAMGATAGEADPLVRVKLFNPVGSWTWYLIEADAATGEAFGFVAGDFPELGYIDLNELSEIKLRWGLKIERDISWKPLPLSKVRELVDARRIA